MPASRAIHTLFGIHASWYRYGWGERHWAGMHPSLRATRAAPVTQRAGRAMTVVAIPRSWHARMHAAASCIPPSRRGILQPTWESGSRRDASYGRHGATNLTSRPIEMTITDKLTTNFFPGMGGDASRIQRRRSNTCLPQHPTQPRSRTWPCKLGSRKEVSPRASWFSPSSNWPIASVTDGASPRMPSLRNRCVYSLTMRPSGHLDPRHGRRWPILPLRARWQRGQPDTETPRSIPYSVP